MAKSPSRTSFHFPAEAVAQLKVIAEIAGFANPGDVIRTAILRLDEMLNIYGDGAELFLVTADGKKLNYHYRMPVKFADFDRYYSANLERPSTDEAAQYFFSGPYLDSIARIRAKLGSSSNAEVIRVAMACFRDLIVASRVGAQIWYHAANGATRKIDIHQSVEAQAKPVEAPAQPRLAAPALAHTLDFAI